MKTQSVFLVFVVLLLLSPTLSSAQSPQTKPSPADAAATKVQEIRTRVEERIQARPETVEQRRASQEAKIADRKKTIIARVIAHAQRMLDRANSMIARMDSIWQRVLSRIDKFTAAGKDTTDLADEIAAVETKKQEALQTIQQAKDTLANLETTGEATASKTAIRQEFQNVRTAIKAYHQAIISVIVSLKGMSGAGGASTAPTTVPTGEIPTETPMPPSDTPTP